MKLEQILITNSKASRKNRRTSNNPTKGALFKLKNPELRQLNFVTVY